MKAYDHIATDVDGARYCLGCAPMNSETAEHEGIGGPVFVADVDATERCDRCGDPLLGW